MPSLGQFRQFRAGCCQSRCHGLEPRPSSSRNQTRKAPLRRAFRCAEEDSNLHPVIPDQALNLVTRLSYASVACQIVRIVPKCGRYGRIGRSGRCHGSCHEPAPVGVARRTALDETFRRRLHIRRRHVRLPTHTDAAALPVYEFTTRLATLEAPPSEMQQLLGVAHSNGDAMDAFVSMTAGSGSPVEFFDPEHIGRVMSAVGIADDQEARPRRRSRLTAAAATPSRRLWTNWVDDPGRLVPGAVRSLPPGRPSTAARPTRERVARRR